MPDTEFESRADVSLARLLAMLMQAAADLLGFHGATTSTRRGREIDVAGATDQTLIALAEAQHITGDGPSVATLDRRQPIAWRADDRDQPWPEYQAAAQLSGIRGSLSVNVPVDHGHAVTASLTLYARTPVDIGSELTERAAMFASLIGLVIESGDGARESAQLASELTEAMRSRAVIEQAKGILMAEQRIAADDAFSILAAMSKSTNTKLRIVAASLVQARSDTPVPEPPRSGD